MPDVIEKLTARKDILLLVDYNYYDKRYYGNHVAVFFFCGGKKFAHTYDPIQTGFGVQASVEINNPKEWIDYIDVPLSRESTIILANFGITGLKRGVNL